MPTEIDRHEAHRLMEAGAQLVDVLSTAEFDAEHIAGAFNIPLTELNRETVARLDRERPVIVYCNDYQ